MNGTSIARLIRTLSGRNVGVLGLIRSTGEESDRVLIESITRVARKNTVDLEASQSAQESRVPTLH
eukprot:4218975-Amphidinium_carterae.1